MPPDGTITVLATSPRGRFLWSLFGLLVRIDHLARLILRRRYYDLGRDVPELADVITLDVLELHLEHARLRPFARGPERHVADQGLERGVADVIGEFVVVEAFRGRYRLLQDLKLRVAPGRDVVAQHIDAFRRRPHLIPLHELRRAAEIHLVDRKPEVIVDEAVEQRAELGLDRGRLQPDHATADHLWLVADLVDRAYESDRVRRIGEDGDDVRIGRLDSSDDRREVGGRRRIALVVDDLEAGRFDVRARAFRGVDREFGIGCRDRDRLRLRVLRNGGFKETLARRYLRGRPQRDHGEVFRIVELGIDSQPEQADQHLLLLNHHGHRRRQQVRAVPADDDVDLVEVEQLLVQGGDRGRIALIVVIHELDRTAEQPALGVDVLLPDPLREQRRLAVGSEPAGLRDAVADLDRIAGLSARRHGAQRETHRSEQPRTQSG